MIEEDEDAAEFISCEEFELKLPEEISPGDNIVIGGGAYTVNQVSWNEAEKSYVIHYGYTNSSIICGRGPVHWLVRKEKRSTTLH